jgi:hypothetical protein
MLIIEKKFTRFRISCHQLIIETGRYKKISAHLRICKHCNANDIGDEMHFLLFCNKFNKDREDLMEVVNKECCNFSQLLPKDKFIWLMSNENSKVLLQLSKCIYLKVCD